MDSLDLFFKKYAYKFSKGYPDMNNEQDINLLADLLENVGINLKEQQMEIEFPVTNNELENIKKFFENKSFQEDYKKYLTVFHYFSPNALGEISEVILTNLINKYGGDIKADHTGGSQGWADITLKDGTEISVKTTTAGKPIGLGSNIETEGSLTEKIVTYFQQTLNKSPKTAFEVGPVKDIKDPIKNDIDKKINAVAEKLSGGKSDTNKKIFVWIEKIKTKKVLSALRIHTFDFNYDDVKSQLEEGTLYITETGAWGIKSGNKPLIQADKSKKLLNITPYFIDSMYKEKTRPELIKILEPEEIKNIEDKYINIKDKLPPNFFESLDQIYKAMFSK
jgi:hypothetical protein